MSWKILAGDALFSSDGFESESLAWEYIEHIVTTHFEFDYDDFTVIKEEIGERIR